LQVLVESRCLARLMVAFCEAGCVASCVGIEAGSEFEIAVLLVEVRGDRFAPRDVFVDRVQCRQPCGRAIGLAFYLDMIAHHEQAVEMALVQLGNDGDPTVAGFAREIVIFQQYEIGRMDEALRRWGVERDDRGDTAMAWMGMAVPVDSMPGLAGNDEFDELRASTGPDADALFLELMADHHRGGVHMAAYAADNATDPGVRALATRMERNQSIEINEYRSTADRLGLDVDIDPIDVADHHEADAPG
jgi:uncharacterized protein (DUF305 family)